MCRYTSVLVPPFASNSPAALQKTRDVSLQMKRARLFNLIPLNLRNMTGVSVEVFKAALDIWLCSIPDQPTTDGRQRAALTNSLIDQVNYNRLEF